MKYCIPYYRASNYNDTIDEVTVLATEKIEIGGIQGFMDTRPPEQRVVFIFRNLFNLLDELDFDLLATVLKDKNYTICWQEASATDLYHIIAERCKAKGLHFCFSDAVYTFDTLYGLCDIGVSDVYISGDLGFNVDALKRCKYYAKFTRDEDLIIRAYPDICQSKWTSFTQELAFWIRPEDVDNYEGAIDVMQTWVGQYGKDYADVWYDVYSKDKFWLGDLNKLIRGLYINDKPLDGRCFTKEWGEMRSGCGRKCLQNSQCTFCRQAVAAAQKMHDLKLAVKDNEEVHTALYYELLETWDKRSAEEKLKVAESVKKVLGEYYEESVNKSRNDRADRNKESD